MIYHFRKVLQKTKKNQTKYSPEFAIKNLKI